MQNPRKCIEGGTSGVQPSADVLKATCLSEKD